MPIKVQCACGAAFAAKDELAGRTVKCPKCQQPLSIPAVGAVPPAGTVPAAQQRQQAPAAAAVARPISAPLPSQNAPAAHPAGDLFAEAGLHAHQAGTVPCPGCATPMPINAVICIKCGYNKKIGRRMETVKGGATGPAIPGGHGVTVDELLNKAARTMEEEKEEERKKTAEGMPWWVYLIGITVVVGFMIAMMFIPQQTAMRVGGWTIIVLGWLVALYSGIRLLIIAFQESVLQGILCMMFWPYQLIYIFTRWDKCGGLFLMNFGAGFIVGVGIGALAIAEMLAQPDEGSLHRQHPQHAAAISRPFDSRFDLDLLECGRTGQVC